MKYLTSNTGEKFNWMLTANKKFVFDPIVPVEVEDDDLPILIKRLGVNIKEVSMGSTSKKTSKKDVEVLGDENSEVSKDVE